jgi:hypothetical protein
MGGRSFSGYPQEPIRMEMNSETTEELDRAYAALRLGSGASLAEVKSAYAAQIRIEGRSEGDWVRLKEMDWAYEVLIEHLLSRPAGIDRQGCEGEQDGSARSESGVGPTVVACLFPPDEESDSLSSSGRALLSVILTVWGFIFIFSPIEGDYVGRSFMHLINLPFHEAGHVIFSFLGDFLRVLGGTLTQVLIPLVCVIAFVRKGDVFGAACALWWVGQSFIDAAPYIYDTRAGELMLLGGVTGLEAPEFHDWHNILGRLGLLSWDHSIAYASKSFGTLVILCSFGWSWWYLLRHYGNLRKGKA